MYVYRAQENFQAELMFHLIIMHPHLYEVIN